MTTEFQKWVKRQESCISKYNTGDKVKILVGHEIFSFGKVVDISPELVGKEAIVLDFNSDRTDFGLKIKGHGTIYWFNDNAVEMIAPNPNTL